MASSDIDRDDDAMARGLQRVGPWLFPVLTVAMALPLLLA